jgi:two-component system response regulator RegA
MLVVDDDETFRDRLVRALAARGIDATGASNADEAMSLARRLKPQRAVIDLRMPGRNGLELIRGLLQVDARMQIILLTGYGSISTAVEAVRLGAIDYLTKPADTEQILSAFEKDYEHNNTPVPLGDVPSLARVEWEHIHRILADTGGNISQAARILGIHRRSLQRKLAKLPPLE